MLSSKYASGLVVMFNAVDQLREVTVKQTFNKGQIVPLISMFSQRY